MNDRAPLPDFEHHATGNQRFQLSAFKGHPCVLYFYPKDNTPGCTVEGQQFRDLHDEFRKARVAVFGISRDSVKSHEGFKAKMGFPFELLSDPDEHACEVFGVMTSSISCTSATRSLFRATTPRQPCQAIKRRSEWSTAGFILPTARSSASGRSRWAAMATRPTT